MTKRKELSLRYFPHTDDCPIDGKTCIKNQCKYWIGEKRCWRIEVQDIISSIFNIEDHNYIYFRDEKNYPIDSIRCLHFYLRVDNREDFKEPIMFNATIGFNSYRLAELVQKKFDLLDWMVRGVAYEGGDDADMDRALEVSPEKKDELVKFIIDIKNMIPTIIGFEKEVNTCPICKIKAEALFDHDGKAICGGCERRIIKENIDKYLL